MSDFRIGVSPAVEALRKAASPRNVNNAHQLPGSASRLTPLELDANLQVSELMYRNLLQGKKVQMDFDTGMDSWYRELFGEDWVKKNTFQRRELERQAKENGENTPMWVESASASSDLASEVLQLGRTGGECLRTGAVDREVVLELLESLEVKLRISHYARCGVGEKQNGLRAMLGVMWHFYSDVEIISLCADCLRLAILGNQYNCDSLLAIWTPAFPKERHHGQTEKGWSFLRIALDAFTFQAGGDIFPRADSAGSGSSNRVGHEEAALKLAQCILQARHSPVMEAQLRLLKEDPGNESLDRQELKEMLPNVLRVTNQLAGRLKGSEVLSELQQLLELAK